jgi:hypothetical protein
MINHDQLPSIPNAKLPAAYTVAKRALAECGKVDECKDWADKAAALGSYAKQSGDKSLSTWQHASRPELSAAVVSC